MTATAHPEFVTTLFFREDDPNRVTVALTMALEALNQGHSAAVILMVDGVHLAREGAFEGIDIGAPFRDAPGLLKEYVAKGGQMKVCGACMIHNDVAPESLAEGMEIIKAPEVVTLLMNAKSTLQLN